MLKRLIVCHKLNKFYKQFWEVLGYGYDRITLRDLKHHGFLLDAQFAINEILEAQSDCFCEESYALNTRLNKLYNQLNTLKENTQ
jgi:hypothetical protein